VYKPEWGTKRTCPKCGERFYDLNKPIPLECVACGATFEPEVVLKSKQPIPEEAVEKPKKAKVDPDDIDDIEDLDDIDIDDDDEDIIEDDLDDDDNEVAGVISKKPSGDDDA